MRRCSTSSFKSRISLTPSKLLQKLLDRLRGHYSGLPRKLARHGTGPRGNGANTKTRGHFGEIFGIHFGHEPAPDAVGGPLATSGATILHGAHHGAQKSTSTGSADWPMSASNSVGLRVSIGSEGDGSSVWHWLQRKVWPRRS